MFRNVLILCGLIAGRNCYIFSLRIWRIFGWSWNSFSSIRPSISQWLASRCGVETMTERANGSIMAGFIWIWLRVTVSRSLRTWNGKTDIFDGRELNRRSLIFNVAACLSKSRTYLSRGWHAPSICYTVTYPELGHIRYRQSGMNCVYLPQGFLSISNMGSTRKFFIRRKHILFTIMRKLLLVLCYVLFSEHF